MGFEPKRNDMHSEAPKTSINFRLSRDGIFDILFFRKNVQELCWSIYEKNVQDLNQMLFLKANLVKKPTFFKKVSKERFWISNPNHGNRLIFFPQTSLIWI